MVSQTLQKRVWRDTTIIREKLKNDLVDDVHLTLYPITIGKGKRALPNSTKRARS